MNTKQQALRMLRDEFDRWEALLADLTEDQISAQQLPADLSIKDVLYHLRAWQEISIARLDAALSSDQPMLPTWLNGLEPDSEENLEQINSWILQASRNLPWSAVYETWRVGYLRLLDLTQQIPEADLLDPARYPWMKHYPLLAVLQGTFEHHHVDHLEPLANFLHKNGAS